MLHELKPTTKNKKAKTVGRGGTRGKTAGRGTKGQKARSGHRIRPQIRDITKKLAKLCGRGKNINKTFRLTAQVVNLDIISMNFEKGASITPSTLFAKGLIKRHQGILPQVKILGTGKITGAYSFYECSVSATAKTKIEAAGGKVN